jgi:hypothetical protein
MGSNAKGYLGNRCQDRDLQGKVSYIFSNKHNFHKLLIRFDDCKELYFFLGKKCYSIIVKPATVKHLVTEKGIKGPKQKNGSE